LNAIQEGNEAVEIHDAKQKPRKEDIKSTAPNKTTVQNAKKPVNATRSGVGKISHQTTV
jgi:hypothetical protein